jgi:Xaa-Pro dipeptidase
MTRARKIAESCAETDAVVISNGTSPFLDSLFWYVTEQTPGSFEGSFAIISGGGSLDVVTSRLEETTARKGKGNIHIYETRGERDSILSELLRDCNTIGVSGRSISYNASEYLRYVIQADLTDVSLNLSAVTSVKDKKEIAEIRRACGISSAVAEMIPEMLREGMTEREVSRMIDSEIRNNGGTGNAFDTIAAFGPNSAEPHCRPSDRALVKGDTALFDFGAKYGLYCSDLTRTVFFGEPEDILRRAYTVVAEAKEAGMREMYDGSPVKNADAAARNVIDGSEFKGRFIHSFGHGIGMNIHESPSVSVMSEEVFREGMVVSAEPGIYIPGIGGIRMEDTVLITRNGAEPLTEFDKNIRVI